MSFEPWAWESENWGGDPEGPLAKALERARSQKPKPLKLIKLPHKDQTSLTEFKEKGIKLKKDSCCCGATKKDPCECMYNGNKCNANNPMCACYKSQENSKGHMSFAESFEAQEYFRCKNCDYNVELGVERVYEEGYCAPCLLQHLGWEKDNTGVDERYIKDGVYAKELDFNAETFGTEVFEAKPMQSQFYKTKSQRLATLNRAVPVGVKHLKEYIHRWNGKTFFDMASFTPEDIEEGWERIKNQLRSKEIIYSIEDLQRDYNRVGRAVQGAGAVYIDSPTMKGPKGEYADDVDDAWQYLYGDLVEIGEQSGYSYKDWNVQRAESFEAQATNIDWETDGQEVDLPKKVKVPDDLDADEIADYLSDKYDFLVNSFQIKDAEEGYTADWENSPYSSWDDAWSDDVNFPTVEKREKLWLKNLTTIGVLAGAIYIGRKIKGV